MDARMVHFHFPCSDNKLLFPLLLLLFEKCCNRLIIREAIQHPTYPDPTIAAVATLSVCATMVVIVDRIGYEDSRNIFPPRMNCNLLLLPQDDVLGFKL